MMYTTSTTFAPNVLERHMREGAAALDALKAAMRSAPDPRRSDCAEPQHGAGSPSTTPEEVVERARALLAGFHTDFPQPDSTDTKKS